MSTRVGIMKDDISVLKSEYELKSSLYEKLCREIKAQLSELLHRQRIELALPIESRVKSWESITEKCQRRNITSVALAKIGDIAGLRIVLLFMRDQQKVCDIIRECFEVLEVEDTTNRLPSDQFGYGSVHFQIRLKVKWLVVPTLSELQGLQAEIQGRTASQHIWAEASHFLQYKSKIHVPKPVLRTINRAAALLEEVDLAFDNVLTKRETYVSELGAFEGSQPLNTDVLEKVLADEFPPENKVETDNLGSLLDDFIAFGIDNVQSLKQLLKKHRNAIVTAEKAVVKDLREAKKENLHTFFAERAVRGVFFTHGGLARQALRKEFGEAEFEEYMRKKQK